MTTIREDDFSVALINTFYVKPEKADELVKLLTKATDEVMRHQPGFISANLHISLDKTRVVNYAQWRSKEDFERMQQNPDAKPHMKQAAELAERFEPILYSVVHVDNRAHKAE
jgi:quinol monooxygenase YgiN